MADVQTDDPALRPLNAYANPDAIASVAPPPPTPSGEDDPALRPLTPFNPEAGVTPYAPAPTWHAADLPKGLEVGWHAGVGAPLAEVTGQTEEAEAEREYAGGIRKGMTPGAEETWPVWGTEQVLPTTAMIAPLLIPGVGLPVGAAVAGAIGGGGAISEFKETIANTNDIDLQQSNETYAGYRKSGMTEAEAKAKLGMDNAVSVGVPAAMLSAGMALAGGAELTGALKLGVGEAEAVALGKGLTRRVSGPVPSAIVGAGRGLVEQGVPGAIQTAITGQQQKEAGIGEEATGTEILSGGVGQGLGGALFVTPFAAWHGRINPHPRELTQTPGKSSIAREPDNTDYRKPATQAGAPTDTTAPPPDLSQKVDPAQNEALKPEPVTQGVTEPPPVKPPTEPVEQPPVVQPEPPPSETATEAPPAPDTTGEPHPPTGEAEAAPAPSVAPPREDVGAVTPESTATLEEQHAALLDPNDPREAMVYPKGEQPFDLPDKSFGQVKLPDGRIVQFDKDGASGLSVAKIRQYAKDDRLNEALGLGPVTKTEALQRAAAGEQPAVVTERTPAGTEVKAAAGTTETAPAQAEALDRLKGEGNRIGVETPEQTVGDRLKAVQAEMAARSAEMAAGERGQFAQLQEQAVQPKVVEDYPQGKAPVAPTGRVLEAQDEAAQRARDQAIFEDRQQALRVQDELKRKEAARQKALAEAAGVKERSHAGQEAIDKIASDNAAAQRIADAHKAPVATDNVRRPTEIYNRAKAIAEAAKQAGIAVPKVFAEGHPYNAAMLKIREAMDLTAKKVPKWDAYARYLDRENLIDNGRGEEAFAARRDEGALGLGSPEGAAETRPKGGAVDEEGKAEARSEAVHEETPIEHMAGGGEEEAHEEKAPDALAAARAEREEKIAKARAESEAMRKEAAERGEAAPKAAVGFQQVVKKSRAIKKLELEDLEARHEGSGEILATDNNRNPVALQKSRTTSAEDALKELHDPKKYSYLQRAMQEKLIPALLKLAGDVDVHFVSHDELMKNGMSVHGFYDPNMNHIVLNADRPRYDTMLHELFHAATSKGLDTHPELMNLLQRLRREAAGQVASPGLMRLTDKEKFNQIKYAFSDPEEFLTHIMTNANVHDFLKNVKISDELARDIGIPKWRKATMWEGALSIIRQALGLGPRDTSAVEAAMAITENVLWTRDPGMLAQAAGRLDHAEAAERTAPVTLSKVRFSQMEPEEAIHERADEAQEATQKPPGFWDSELAKSTTTGTYQKVLNAYIKASNTDSLRIDNEHLFGEKTEKNSFLRAQEGLLNQGGMIQRMLKNHNPLLQRLMDMKRMNPNGLDRLITLLSESADYNVHPDEMLGTGLNEHIKSNPKSGEYDHTTADSQHEAILAHPRLSDEFNNSTPEEQRLFQDLRDTLMEEGHKNVKAGIEAFTQGVKENFAKDEKLQEALKTPEANRTPSDIKRVERYNAVSKVLDGDKLEGDEAEKFNADPHISMVRDLRGMLKQEGPHFPGTRKGDWVVNAEHELPEAKNALSVKDNEVTFGSEEEAYDYRQQLVDKSLPSRMEKVSEPTSTAQQPGQGKQWKVMVQLKHSSAVNDVHAGRQLGAALREMGLKNVTEPMLREKNPHMEYGLNSGTVRAMDHAIDALTYLDKDQKQALKDANEQASLGLMRGNRINRGLLRSNRVRGANADPVLAVHDYLANSARSQARSKTQGDIDKAIGEMRETTRNVQDKDTPRRGMLVREMEDRARSFGKDGFTGQMSPMLQKFTTLAYLKDMMAPIHYALDLTHPYLYSIPQLAGRHGFGNAHGAYLKSLNMIGAGGVLGKGMKGVFKAAAGHAPTDLMGGIRETMVRNGATADQLKAFDSAKDTHLSSIITDYSKAFDRTGALDRGAQYLQNIGNEMSHAVDSVNRTATYMAAYDLERVRMGKANTLAENIAHHAQAVRYAKDTVSQTQNLYSAANRSSFMRDPKIRAVMQFRSVPMMIYRLLAKNVYNAVRGETPEIQRAAIISLVSTMGTTAALAGAASGVPEPIRLAVEMSHALGLTDSWEGYEDRARRMADNSLGKFGGHLAMDGILGAAGLDASSRIGLQDLMVKNQALASPKDFLLEMVGGAYTGYAKDEWTGVNNLLAGNYAKGIPGVIPIRMFSDIAKAYMENQEGKTGGKNQPDMTPLDPYETFIKAAGGTPTREALYGKEQGLIKEAGTERKAAIAAGASGNRDAVTKWNMQHPANRITAGHILKQRQASRAGPKPLTPKQRATQEEYNVYQ